MFFFQFTPHLYKKKFWENQAAKQKYNITNVNKYKAQIVLYCPCLYCQHFCDGVWYL
jgi:hypothetical protein